MVGVCAVCASIVSLKGWMLAAFWVVKDRHTLAARAFDFKTPAQVVALREQLVTDTTAVLRRVFVHNRSFWVRFCCL